MLRRCECKHGHASTPAALRAVLESQDDGELVVECFPLDVNLVQRYEEVHPQQDEEVRVLSVDSEVAPLEECHVIEGWCCSRYLSLVLRSSSYLTPPRGSSARVRGPSEKSESIFFFRDEAERLARGSL